MIVRRLSIAMAFALACCSAWSQETVFREVYHTPSDTHVEVTALFSASPNIGYLPLRVKAVNNLASDRSITIVSESRDSYHARIECSSVHPLKVPAGTTVTRDLLIPVSPPNDTGSSQSHLSIRLAGNMGETQGSVPGGTPVNWQTVLLSESLFIPNASALDSAASGSTSSYRSEKFAAQFNPKMLPSDWLAFSGYDVIALTRADWHEIPAGPRSALLSWLRQGGTLIFADATFARNEPGLPANTGLGTIAHFPTPSATFADPKAFVDMVRKAKLPIAASTAGEYSSSWPLAGSFGSQNFNYFLFFLVAIVFSILVGPVNLFVFAKSGKRHRLFLTTPLISLGASVVMIALIILQDGFGGAGARVALMEIQQGPDGHTAHVHQEQVSRSGVLLGPSFTVDPASLIAPVVMEKSRWTRFSSHHRTKGNFDIQPEGGKIRVSGSWWQSRSEQGQYLSSVVPTRGRIERGKDAGTWISSFSFPLDSVYFRDETGAWSKAENVRTGVPFRATPAAPAQVEPHLVKLGALFTGRNNALFSTARSRGDSFVATTSAAPAIETLRSIRWKDTKTVITGMIE